MQFSQLFKMIYGFEITINILLNIKHSLKSFCLFPEKQTNTTTVKIDLQDHHPKPNTSV